ncbi:hypothetical protein [Rhizobium sp. CSW-27]|uniref:hypothetical protein n=1 Tax=Rhizobium sp. CSW-27 TaxID=2839985 RepID=UPI001C02BDE5|nr:hypothetical protein [Rhizobium sp. CSW-27]MBT9371785.1 hypothetical protein [Rhizobium sp. CSW-27]
MPTPDYRNIDPATVYPRALQAMRNPGFLKSPRYQEQQTRANRVGAHPHILEFSDKLVKRGAALGIPLFAHCIVRTFDEQAAAFVLGHSKDHPDDGLWPHRCAAVDIIHGTLGWMDQPNIPHAWDVIGHLGHEVARSMDIKITWGGDWDGDGDTMDNRLYDPAHFELSNWRQIAISGDKYWSPHGASGTVER